MAIELHNRTMNIGSIIKYHDNLSQLLMEGIEAGYYTIAFDFGCNRNFTRKRIDIEDLEMGMGISTRFPTVVMTILPSMYNLCGNIKFLAWNGNDLQDKRTSAILKEIEYELFTVSKMGGTVVTELGSFRDKKQGMSACIKSINKIKFRLGSKIILINSADEHNNVGITLKDLQQICGGVNSLSSQYIGVGLNLTKLHDNKLYDTTTVHAIQKMFKEYDRMFNKPLMVILVSNLSDGERWSDDSVSELVQECYHRNIPLLTETDEDVYILGYIADEMFL